MHLRDAYAYVGLGRFSLFARCNAMRFHTPIARLRDLFGRLSDSLQMGKGVSFDNAKR